MNVLIIGTPGSGKSAFAEKKAAELASGRPMAYIATMIPYGEEGKARVEKHRRMRAGKGFVTVECPKSVDRLSDGRGSGEKLIKNTEQCKCTCLLECMSNLVGNEMHADENSELDPEQLCRLICREVQVLGEKSKNLIVVANEFEPAGEGYDHDTEAYVELISRVNLMIRGFMDEVYIRQDGEWILEKTI